LNAHRIKFKIFKNQESDLILSFWYKSNKWFLF